MIIVVACPVCARRYDVPGKLAGKQVRCKQCANKFRVPVPVTMPRQERAPSQRRSQRVADELLEEILGPEDPSSPEDEIPIARIHSHPRAAGSTKSPVVRIVGAMVVCGLILAWFFEIGPPGVVAVALGVISVGLVLLTLISGR